MPNYGLGGLHLRREAGIRGKDRIYVEVDGKWVATIVCTPAPAGVDMIQCIGPKSTKFIRGELRK